VEAEDLVGMLKVVVVETLADLDLDGLPNLPNLPLQPIMDHLEVAKAIALAIVDHRIRRDLTIRITDLVAGEMVQVTVPGTLAQERAPTHMFQDVQGMTGLGEMTDMIEIALEDEWVGGEVEVQTGTGRKIENGQLENEKGICTGDEAMWHKLRRYVVGQ
jgi:hypothetical protein